jgi:hypothetical protein
LAVPKSIAKSFDSSWLMLLMSKASPSARRKIVPARCRPLGGCFYTIGQSWRIPPHLSSFLLQILIKYEVGCKTISKGTAQGGTNDGRKGGAGSDACSLLTELSWVSKTTTKNAPYPLPLYRLFPVYV